MKRVLCGRLIILCLLLSLLGLFAAGCSNITNKLYLYAGDGVDYDWGSVGGRMVESYTSTPTESIASSPYLLAISFESMLKVDGSVTMLRIDLTDADGNVAIYKSSEPRTEIFNTKSYGKTYNAVFLIRGLKPDYVNLKLQLKYKIKTDQFTHDGETTLYLDTAYKEYRSNKYWDMLMGV